jgi:predicted RecB family endonuclease
MKHCSRFRCPTLSAALELSFLYLDPYIMAEVVGLFASGVAVIQLATRIISVSEKLHRFCGGVKGIPKRISDLLEEIQMLAKTLKQMPLCENDVAQECLRFVEETMAELETFLKEVEVKMDACRGGARAVVGRVKAVMKDQEMVRLVARLERTKGTFEIAVRAYHM